MVRWDASLEMVPWASLPQLPYVSTANGMQDQPNSWHLGPLEWSLRASAAKAAAPADLLKMTEQSGEVMVRSSAAGLPLSQPAIRMSAGLVWARSL